MRNFNLNVGDCPFSIYMSKIGIIYLPTETFCLNVEDSLIYQ